VYRRLREEALLKRLYKMKLNHCNVLQGTHHTRRRPRWQSPQRALACPHRALRTSCSELRAANVICWWRMQMGVILNVLLLYHSLEPSSKRHSFATRCPHPARRSRMQPRSRDASFKPVDSFKRPEACFYSAFH